MCIYVGSRQKYNTIQYNDSLFYSTDNKRYSKRVSIDNINVILINTQLFHDTIVVVVLNIYYKTTNKTRQIVKRPVLQDGRASFVPSDVH